MYGLVSHFNTLTLRLFRQGLASPKCFHLILCFLCVRHVLSASGGAVTVCELWRFCTPSFVSC